MKNTIGIVVVFMFLSTTLMGQTEYYTIEEAIRNKQDATSLFLNYSFQEVVPIMDSIGELTNLEEFRIFPRWINYPSSDGNDITANEIYESEIKTPKNIPNEITKCQKLRLIDVSNSDVSALPENLSLLHNLETLILSNSDVDMSLEIDKIVELKNLKQIELFEIDLSQEQRFKLETLPNLKIISNEGGSIKGFNDEEAVDIQIHDTYMVFRNEEQANRFMNSMPVELKEDVKIYRKNNR